jgi:hypothetical protein
MSHSDRVCRHASIGVTAAFLWIVSAPGAAVAQTPATRVDTLPASRPADYRPVLDRYCVTCHNDRLKTASLVLSSSQADLEHVAEGAEVWEKVLQKLKTQSMPPPGSPRPDAASYRAFGDTLEQALDQAAAARPDPGRPTLHRLNRAEYANAIRDLVALEIDTRALLPADDMSFGFDNNADRLSVSPGLLERYMAAARRISRVAIGDPTLRPAVETYKVSPMALQDDRMSEDLPFGSRGGISIRHYFPLDAEYTIRIQLQRDAIYTVRGLAEPEEIDVRLDGATVAHFQLGGGPRPKGVEADAGLEVRVPVKAGTYAVGVSFPKRTRMVAGSVPGRLPVANFILSPTARALGFPELMAIASVQVGGPYAGMTPASTPSRSAIFICRPATLRDEACAGKIVERLARRAYRRPVGREDLSPLMAFYRLGARRAGFDAGIQEALARILVDPEFLFRVEHDPTGLNASSAYRVSDLELASRLSFFLWSSIPDDELLHVAAEGRLKEPDVLARQVRRMLDDPRSSALVSNFAVQWLHLRNVRAISPDVNLFPEFDDNLREAMQQETELFVASQIREDRRVGELLTANDTFLNERLARHYGIPGVHGSHFRRVTLDDGERAGLLGQASILTVTSHATRTSPVLRGKWILENLLGAPPPPPPNVPTLPDRGDAGEAASVRERLELHRRNPACASCHSRMDPLGFALERYDAVGRWRTDGDEGTHIDTAASLPDGTTFDGPAELRQLLVSRQDEVANTVATKLLTYALGRGIEFYDKPALRAIVREAAAQDYRWSSIIVAIAQSVPFQMRRAE